MRLPLLLGGLLALWTLAAPAAHITDKLLAGFYDQPGAEEPARVLPSGTPLEVLEQKDKHVKVRLGDGATGWVERRFITDETPARARLLQLQAETGNLRQDLKQTQTALKKAQARLDQRTDASAAQQHKELKTAKAQLATARLELEKRRDCPAQEAPADNQQDHAQQQQRLEALWEENRILRDRILQASAQLSAPLPDPAEAPGYRFSLWHLLIPLIFTLTGLIGGIAYRNYRIRRRYGGFRL